MVALLHYRFRSAAAFGLLGVATTLGVVWEEGGPPAPTSGEPRAPWGNMPLPAGPLPANEAIALSAMAIHRADPEGRHRGVIVEIASQLLVSQWNETRGIAPEDPRFGGIGASPQAEPDLWHTALAVEALRAAGFRPDDISIVQACSFVSGCQRLDGSATTETSSHYGGFASIPEAADAVCGKSIRPTGLSTCAGLLALRLGGAALDDPRIAAGQAWLSRHYTLQANPGASPPRRHLYEFYMVFASAMTSLGVDVIRDAGGADHPWRRELADLLVAQQRSDGSWVNPDESADPVRSQPLATTYFAMRTLSLLQQGPAIGAPPGAPENPAPPRRAVQQTVACHGAGRLSRNRSSSLA